MLKRIAAKELFICGKKNKEISELLNVNYNTVKKWSSRDKWNNLFDEQFNSIKDTYKDLFVEKVNKQDNSSSNNNNDGSSDTVTNCKETHIKVKNSKYHEYVKPRLKEIENWKSTGFTEEEISKKLYIGYTSFKKYKKSFSTLMATLKKGEENRLNKVEDILNKKAAGEYIEEIEIINYDKNGNIVEDSKTGIARQITKKKLADTTASIFILKNKKPEQYNIEFIHKKEIDREKLEIERNRNNIEIEGNNNKKAILEFIEATSPKQERLEEIFKDEE